VVDHLLVENLKGLVLFERSTLPVPEHQVSAARHHDAVSTRRQVGYFIATVCIGTRIAGRAAKFGPVDRNAGAAKWLAAVASDDAASDHGGARWRRWRLIAWLAAALALPEGSQRAEAQREEAGDRDGTDLARNHLQPSAARDDAPGRL
jgi:hypothetical protein